MLYWSQLKDCLACIAKRYLDTQLCLQISTTSKLHIQVFYSVNDECRRNKWLKIWDYPSFHLKPPAPLPTESDKCSSVSDSLLFCICFYKMLSSAQQSTSTAAYFIHVGPWWILNFYIMILFCFFQITRAINQLCPVTSCSNYLHSFLNKTLR